MDGRVQLPLIEWAKKEYAADYADSITEAGIDGLVANENNSLEAIINKIDTSVNKHGSNNIIIAGHSGCAGNSVSDQTHFSNIEKAVKRLAELRPEAEVKGVWINENWQVTTR
jgi:carbonic anhydrase